MNQYNMLKILPNQGLEPRQFLRYCFGIAELGAESLLEEETDSQYRKKCISVLSCIFNIERATVRKWGTDLNFDGMPNYCKIALAYFFTTGIKSNTVESCLYSNHKSLTVFDNRVYCSLFCIRIARKQYEGIREYWFLYAP